MPPLKIDPHKAKKNIGTRVPVEAIRVLKRLARQSEKKLTPYCSDLLTEHAKRHVEQADAEPAP